MVHATVLLFTQDTFLKAGQRFFSAALQTMVASHYGLLLHTRLRQKGTFVFIPAIKVNV